MDEFELAVFIVCALAFLGLWLLSGKIHEILD